MEVAVLSRMFILWFVCSSVSAAYAQTAPGSAEIPGSDAADCPEIVAGIVNMPDIIEQVGGAKALYDLSQAQIVEYDRWFAEMEAARKQGVRVAEIDALILQGKENYGVELAVSEAALCYMNQ